MKASHIDDLLSEVLFSFYIAAFALLFELQTVSILSCTQKKDNRVGGENNWGNLQT